MNRRELLKGACVSLLWPKVLAQIASRGPGAADDEHFWLQVRDLFPIDPNVVQLNHAAVGCPPRHVLEAVNRYGEMLAAQPSHAYYDEQEAYIEQVRSQLAAFFGCDAGELAITRNASEGLHNIIFGVALKPGEEVLTTTQDYPSMLDSLRQRAEREGIVVKKFQYPVPPASADDLYNRFAREVTPRTRLILVSHMTYTTGQIFPVKRICQMAAERNIEVLVDGAQSFGHIPFRRDDLACDYFAASLHKYFSAPLGTGMLYVRRDRIAKIWPLMGADKSLQNDIRKFDSLGPGTVPLNIRNAIPEAIRFHELISVAAKAERLRYLRRRWMNRLALVNGVRMLTPDDPAQSCGTAAFIPGRWDAQKFVEVLQRDYRMQVRRRGVEGEFQAVRVSPNIFTSADEIDRFCEVAEKVIPHAT